MGGSITDVEGVQAGHAHDTASRTGCTALLFEAGARVGLAPPGPATGTRKADVGRSGHRNETIHGLMLAGGSDYGLDAGGGAMRYLEERSIGVDVGVTVVPIVPTAILFDLAVGSSAVRPDAAMGYAACERATDAPLEEGRVGAGTGATVGKLFGMERACPGGVGTARRDTPDGPIGALAVVNAFGDVLNPATGEILAGLRDPSGERFVSTATRIRQGARKTRFGEAGRHTTLWVVATDAALDKSALTRLAASADQAIVRTHSPARSPFDGDVGFAVATGRPSDTEAVDELRMGLFAQQALEEAIQQAVQKPS